MSNVKNVIMKKKIEGAVYDLLVKTSAEQVTYNDTTLKAKVEEIVASIENLTNGKADAKSVVEAIKASASKGKITYVKNGTDTDVAVSGVVVEPTYDAETRTLTLPVTKADGTTENVVMSLGKDLVVKSGALDANKENIVLVLSNDEEITIPVKSLVDVYTGETTASAVVTVSADNKITAQVRVSTKEGNKLQVIEEEGKEGLFVEAPEAYDDTELRGLIENKVEKQEGYSLVADTEIERLKGVTNYDDTAITAQVNAKARILVSATEPADLTENDIWMQEVQ